MFKAIVYTNKNDKLSMAVVASAQWDKKYVQLFAKGINYDQAIALNDKEFTSEIEAKEAAKQEIARLGGL